MWGGVGRCHLDEREGERELVALLVAEAGDKDRLLGRTHDALARAMRLAMHGQRKRSVALGRVASAAAAAGCCCRGDRRHVIDHQRDCQPPSLLAGGLASRAGRRGGGLDAGAARVAPLLALPKVGGDPAEAGREARGDDD